MSWYKKSFGQDYLTIYPHRNESEAKKIIKFAAKALDLKPGQRVLDLGCGYGRNSAECAALGAKVTGLDLSAELLTLAHKKECQNGKRYTLVRGDMRFIPFKQAFDVVLSLFTSFGYFDGDAENEMVIRAVANALKPGGLFLFDYLNMMQAIPNMTIRDTQNRGNVRIVQERSYNETTNRIEKKITLHDQGETREYTESVRAYRLIDLLLFFERSGFECTALYGDYQFQPFTRTAPRLIMIGEKK